MELADTSAWTNRAKDVAAQADFDARVLAHEIAICDMVVLELLWTAQDAAEFGELRDDLDALPKALITADAWRRAVDVWHELVRVGRQRQVKPADLLIAATAELAGIGLCHYDRDFETIAELTGQPVRAIAPLGSL